MAAIEDIRLHVTFFQSPKTMRLTELLGPWGVLSLLQLWIWVAMNRPSGTLVSIKDDEVEKVACWKGESGAFLKALLDIGFIKRSGKNLKVVSWKKYQDWVVKAPERSLKSKRAAAARWQAKEGRNGSASTSHSAEAIEIYNAYPLQRGRKKALAAIEEALEQSGVTAESLLASTKEYARAVSLWNRGTKKFVPSPAKWFEDARYADDPKTWFVNAPNGKDPNDIDDDFFEGNDL